MLDTEEISGVAEQTLTGLLNELVGLEYGALFFLPQYLPLAPSGIAREGLLQLGQEELDHFDQTVTLLRRLGGRLTTDLPALYPESDLETLLSRQMRREMLAIQLYRQAQHLARLAPPDTIPRDELMSILERLESDEHRHLDLIRPLLDEVRNR